MGVIDIKRIKAANSDYKPIVAAIKGYCFADRY